MGLYKNVQKACEPAGYTITRLESELGYGRGTIAKWEDHAPSAQRVQSVAEKLKTTVEALLKGE